MTKEEELIDKIYEAIKADKPLWAAGKCKDIVEEYYKSKEAKQQTVTDTEEGIRPIRSKEEIEEKYKEMGEKIANADLSSEAGLHEVNIATQNLNVLHWVRNLKSDI